MVRERRIDMRRVLLLVGSLCLPTQCTTFSGLEPPNEQEDDLTTAVNEKTPSAAPPKCDLAKPFGAPIHLSSLNARGEADSDGRVSPDETMIVFGSSRGAGSSTRIWMAARSAGTAAFDPPVLFFSIGSTPVYDPTLSADQQTLYFQQGGLTTPARIRAASRTSGSFGEPYDVPGLHAEGAEERDPFLASDRSIYFSRGNDLYVGRPDARGYIVTRLDALNTSSAERNPVVTADGTRIFFSSDRDVEGKFRIYTAARSDTGFGAVTAVSELSPSPGHQYEAPNSLSTDGCTIYFSSDRTESIDIWSATRPR